MPEQTYRGTHRHRAPLGWHPPRVKPETNGNGGPPPGDPEPTAPFTPTFTDAMPVLTDVPAPQPPPVEGSAAPVEGGHLRRWTFVFVVAAVWVAAAAVGLGLFYWWFHAMAKTPAVFAVLVYLVVCVVAALIAAMVQDRPALTALAIALMSAPFASTAAAAVLYGFYFCEHASRCFAAVLPY